MEDKKELRDGSLTMKPIDTKDLMKERRRRMRYIKTRESQRKEGKGDIS